MIEDMGNPGAPARRDISRASRDARAARTRERLEVGMTAALRETGDPTVGLVCARAGIARSTFYTHFAALDDLAELLLGDTFDALFAQDVERRHERALNRTEIYDIGIAALVDAILDKREIFLWTFRVPSPLTVRLLSRLADDIRTTVRAERGDASLSFLDIASDYISAGFISAIVRWLETHTTSEHPDPAPAERAELLDALRDLSPAWFFS